VACPKFLLDKLFPSVAKRSRRLAETRFLRVCRIVAGTRPYPITSKADKNPAFFFRQPIRKPPSNNKVLRGALPGENQRPLGLKARQANAIAGWLQFRVIRDAERLPKRGVDLISDALPFGRLWYGEPDAVTNAIGYAKFRTRSHDAVIRVYDESWQRD
jgi:hypothetical protein